MLVKSFVLLILILIPLLMFSSKQVTVARPKIIYLTPTPSVVSQVPLITNSQDITTQESTDNKPTSVSIQSTPAVTISTAPKNTLTLNSFTYPGSTVISQGGNSMVLDSNDLPNIITDWYKNKLNQSALNINTIITTSSNDTVSNRLSASNGVGGISVDIHKSSGSSQVNVVISKF